MATDITLMSKAVDMASEGINMGGGPFGALIADANGQILAKSHNQVVNTCDPTAHAEVVCIREACKKLNSHILDGCTIYTTCEPCSMCLSAIYWARLSKIVYGNTREDAQKIGFDDTHIYEEVVKPHNERKIPIYQCSRHETIMTFKQWENKADKVHY
jgi:tRNA(Arg) A34 adenosine deaminase TadA